MRLALVEPLVRRSRQIVRAYPAAAGPSVKPREIVRAVRSCRLGLLSVRLTTSSFPKHGR